MYASMYVCICECVSVKLSARVYSVHLIYMCNANMYVKVCTVYLYVCVCLYACLLVLVLGNTVLQ